MELKMNHEFRILNLTLNFSLYSPKCEKCKKPIAPEPGQQEAMRIIALEKSFHKACFTCKVKSK